MALMEFKEKKCNSITKKGKKKIFNFFIVGLVPIYWTLLVGFRKED